MAQSTIRVRLDFEVHVEKDADTRGLMRVNDFIQGGLQAVLPDSAFPLDIAQGAKLKLDFPQPKKPRRKGGSDGNG